MCGAQYEKEKFKKEKKKSIINLLSFPSLLASSLFSCFFFFQDMGKKGERDYE